MTIVVLKHPDLNTTFALSICVMLKMIAAPQRGSLKGTRNCFLGLIMLLSMSLLPDNVFSMPDTARFEILLSKGNSAYKEKQGYTSFLLSLRYFDSAQIIAEQSGDTPMLAATTFARGRVYDAWNREPEKTIALFTEATYLFYRSGNESQYFYAKHLIAHAYDKMHNSPRAIAVLRELIAELSIKDTATLKQNAFIPEMALIATEVHAYSLADSILKQLTHRAWIANDSSTYNYLDHYFLTQSRLDIYWRKKPYSSYIDSFAAAYKQLTALSDKLFYTRQLADLYAATGNFPMAYQFLLFQQELQRQLMAGNELENMQRALAASELAAEHRKADYETSLSKSRNYIIWGLSVSLAVITVLSIYLYQRTKKYRAQSIHLQNVNGELDRQVIKVELVNKEIQHRVKNNLYAIYSLLHMQQESTDNEQVIAHLGAARMRVESVAALHDHLRLGSDSVNFETYIRELVHKVIDCFSDRRKVVTHITTEPVSLPLNTCFALSLILNEWITNSIKYSIGQENVLNIEVNIANVQGQVCVNYFDDGQPEDQVIPGKGLGADIVRLLTAQIKGKLTNEGDNPYKYNLCIPNV